MNILGAHILILNHDQNQVAKTALAAAGHDLKGFLASEVDKLVLATKAKFPDLVAGIEKLIADAKNKDAKGIDKLEAVALDAIALLPPVLAALPEVKTFALALVQSVFADGEAALVKAAGTVLKSL